MYRRKRGRARKNDKIKESNIKRKKDYLTEKDNKL